MKTTIKYEAILLLLASFAMFFAGTGGFEAFDYDEAIYSATTAEMIKSGDWVAPSFNSKKFYEKPPLLYWLTAAAYNTFPFKSISRAGRSVAAASAAGTTLLIYLFALYYFGEGAARLSALVFVTSLGAGIMSRAILTDGLFTLFASAAFFAAILYIDTGQRKYSMMFYAAAAFSMLAKGPAGPALAGVSAFFYALLSGKNIFKAIGIFVEPAGIAVFLAIAAPWHIAAEERTGGEFFRDFFLVHNLKRFGGKAFEGHSGGVFYYLPVAMFWLFPWSAFLPQALLGWCKHRALAGCVIAAAVPFAVFSLSKTKLPNYAAPMFPPLTVLLGYWLDGFVRRQSRENNLLLILSVFWAAVVGAVTGGAFLFAERYLNANAARLADAAPYLEHGARLGLAPATLAALILSCALWMMFVPFLREKAPRIAVAGLAVFSVAATNIALPLVAQKAWITVQKPLKELTLEAAAEKPDAKIIAYGMVMSPSITLYAERDIVYLGHGELPELAALKKTTEASRRSTKNIQSVMVISKKSEFDRDLRGAGFVLVRAAGGYALSK